MAEAVVPALLFIKFYNQLLLSFYLAKTHLNFPMRYKRKRYNAILFSVINSRQQFLLPVKSFCAHSFHYITGLVSLFLSGRITLKVISYHFHNYLFKIYKYPSPHFEKPTGSFIHCYRHAALFLHLKQWCITNEAVSLIQVHYAEKPRNPE